VGAERRFRQQENRRGAQNFRLITKSSDLNKEIAQLSTSRNLETKNIRNAAMGRYKTHCADAKPTAWHNLFLFRKIRGERKEGVPEGPNDTVSWNAFQKACLNRSC